MLKINYYWKEFNIDFHERFQVKEFTVRSTGTFLIFFLSTVDGDPVDACKAVIKFCIIIICMMLMPVIGVVPLYCTRRAVRY